MLRVFDDVTTLSSLSELGSAEPALGILPIINIDCVFDVRLAHAA